MGWFAKKAPSSLAEPMYVSVSHKSVIIAGLGNPGKKYTATRHNLGFECVDFLANTLDFPQWKLKKDLKCLFSQKVVGNKRVILVKPTVLMNHSGEALRLITQYFEVTPSDLVVIHDELDVPYGQIRTKIGGSSAGHNGLKSVVEHLGAEFGRVRIGIGPKPIKIDSADFVLGKLAETERKHLASLKREAASLLEEFIYSPKLDKQTRYFII